MNKINALGSISLMLGAALNITRILPILATEGVTMEHIPPHTLEATVFVSQTFGYFLSHLMALIATPLLLVGFLSLYKELKRSENNQIQNVAIIAVVGLLIGQIAYSIGLVIDGFTLPAITTEYMQAAQQEAGHLSVLLMGIHKLAISFGGLGFATLLLSTGFLGWAIYQHRSSKLLGIIGSSIGVLALIGYTTGVLDPLVGKSFELTGGLTLLMYVYYFGLGVLRWRDFYQKQSEMANELNNS